MDIHYNINKSCYFSLSSLPNGISSLSPQVTTIGRKGDDYYLLRQDSANTCVEGIKFCPYCGADLHKEEKEHLRLKELSNSER